MIPPEYISYSLLGITAIVLSIMTILEEDSKVDDDSNVEYDEPEEDVEQRGGTGKRRNHGKKNKKKHTVTIKK